MSSDPIADFCTSIRNGYMARKLKIQIPYSKLKEEMAKALSEQGYLKKIKINPPAGGEKLKMKKIEVELKYDEKGKPVLTKIERISKPGLRVYKGSQNIPRVLSGLGIAIVSTPKGLLTGKQAKKQNLGGEIICQVW